MQENQGVTYSCKYRVAWCTKYRRSVLCGNISKRLQEILLLSAKEIDAEIQDLKITNDTVQFLLSVCPQFGVNRAVRHLKGQSSHILREEFPELKSRIPSLWTTRYFVATVSCDNESSKHIKRFILNQERTQIKKKGN